MHRSPGAPLRVSFPAPEVSCLKRVRNLAKKARRLEARAAQAETTYEAGDFPRVLETLGGDDGRRWQLTGNGFDTWYLPIDYDGTPPPATETEAYFAINAARYQASDLLREAHEKEEQFLRDSLPPRAKLRVRENEEGTEYELPKSVTIEAPGGRSQGPPAWPRSKWSWSTKASSPLPSAREAAEAPWAPIAAAPAVAGTTASSSPRAGASWTPPRRPIPWIRTVSSSGAATWRRSPPEAPVARGTVTSGAQAPRGPSNPAPPLSDHGDVNTDPIEAEPMEVDPGDDAVDDVAVYVPQFRRVRSIKCTAKSSRTGQPCGRWAIMGGTTCPMHGSSTTRAKEAARRRLQSMAPFAVAVLAELADGHATDPSTGIAVAVPPGVRQRAAAELLKMSGAGAAQELDLAVSEGAPRPDLDAAIAAALARRDTSAQDPSR